MFDHNVWFWVLIWAVFLSENGVEDEEDLYDCVYDDDEGGEVYEDLMKVELVQPQVCICLQASYVITSLH